MESITAKGILYGEKRTVTIEKEESGLKLSVEESVSSEILEAIKVRFKLCQESANHIFGDYEFPKNTLRSASLALENGFFKNNDYKMAVNGELELIPYEEGVIY